MNKGWIRKFLPNDIKSDNKQLTSKERMVFINTYNLMCGFPKGYGKLKGWQNLFHHAWGVTKTATNNIVNSYYDSGFHAERKERSDKGQTLVNSEKKRRSRYSELFVYKREQTQLRYRNHTYRLDDNELKDDFEAMEEEEKRIYGEIANVMIKQGYGMHNDMITALQKTSGNISYKQIANYIGGLVTEKTIAKHLKTLKGYQIVKSRICLD